MNRDSSKIGPAGRNGVADRSVRRQPVKWDRGTRYRLLDRLLNHDPLPWLLSVKDTAVTTLVRRDLLGEKVDKRVLWELREPQRLLCRQRENGSWSYPTKKPPPQNYNLYQTFVTLGELVYKYGFDRRHVAVQKAGSYIFSTQTKAGDFRGIYGNQPAHTYTPALMEVLVDAGYEDVPEIKRAFQWLFATRQADGGWAIPMRTRDLKLVKDWNKIVTGPEIEADYTKPFSHLVTGMVLRAFAAHPHHRSSAEALHAAELLKSRFFKADKYADRAAPAYWTKFTYPFQFTNILTALDSLGRLGFSSEDADISGAIDWFRQQQRTDGSFAFNMCRGIGDKRLPLWLGLAACRALLRLEENKRAANGNPGKTRLLTKRVFRKC